MSFKTPDARTRESQAKAVQLSVTTVEKHFGELCQLSAGYARKTARLRDKSDLLVRELMAYSETERPSLKMGLRAFAEELSKVQDYRQAQVERLEAKVVEPLKSYGATIKIKREDLKAVLTSQAREAKQMQQLEKMRQRNPSDRHNISQAETELQRATVDAARSSRQLEETINEFERQKIKDIKKILCDFVTVEMVFHAKALEVYSQAYHHMHAVNEESDLEAFLNTLRPSDYQARLDTVLQNSLSTLNGTGSPQPMAKSQTGAAGTQRSNARRLEDDEDDDDDDDEDDDDEDDEDDDDDEDEDQLQDVTSEDLDNRQSGSRR